MHDHEVLEFEIARRKKAIIKVLIHSLPLGIGCFLKVHQKTMIIPATKYLKAEEWRGGRYFTTTDIANAVDPQIKYVAR